MLLLSTGNALLVTDFGDLFTPVQLTAGSAHACALSSSQEIKCWGQNSQGQLGQGHSTPQIGGVAADMGMCALCLFSNDKPRHFVFLLFLGDDLFAVDLGDTFTPVEVRASGDSTCALSDDDRVRCWGRNDYGQLGLWHTTSVGTDASHMGDNLYDIDLGVTIIPVKLSESAVSFCSCALSNNLGLYFFVSVIFGQTNHSLCVGCVESAHSLPLRIQGMLSLNVLNGF